MRLLTNGLIGGKRSIKRPSKPKQPKSSKNSSKADSVKLSGKRWSISRGLTKALLAASFITALSGPIAAQTPAGTAPLLQESVKTEMVQDSIKPEFNVRLNFINDNGPPIMSRALGNSSNVIPDSPDFADDDGWTSELSIQAFRKKGDTETVAGARLQMLTETGSWTGNPEYQGRRTDIAEFVVQRNFIKKLDDNTTFTYGVGGGVQGIGNMGGETVQRWWHESGPFGGRTGDALQSQYTSDGFRVVPMLTGGAQLTQSISPKLDFNIANQTNLPIGSGVGQTSLYSSLSTELGPVSLELGGKVDGSWSMAQETDFHDIDGVRAGAFGRVEVDAKYGSVYGQVDTGGFRGEPVLTVGVRIGLGGKPTLNPFR